MKFQWDGLKRALTSGLEARGSELDCTVLNTLEAPHSSFEGLRKLTALNEPEACFPSEVFESSAGEPKMKQKKPLFQSEDRAHRG